MPIPYVRNPTWADGSGGGTPVNAAKLNTIDQGIVDAHYMPAVRVYHNAAQATVSGTRLALALNSERFDQASNLADTMHDTVTNNSRLTCRYAGVYLITGNIEWASTVSHASGADAAIRLNNATLIQRHLFISNDERSMDLSTIYALAVNDYVELTVLQNTGAGVNINSTANVSPEFGMVRVA